MRNIFYNNFVTIYSTAIKGILIYIFLIIALRISGKRSLSKLNIFDFIITIAIGSVFASVLTTKDVKLAQGTTAIIVLLGGQYIISRLAYKYDKFEEKIKSDPALLYYDNKFLYETMKVERVTEREILQAVRSSGVGSLEKVQAVILESQGSISVITKSDDSSIGLDSHLYDPVKASKKDNQ
ncbi:DUF421 domain-containing protein [Anaerococcus cruorum]|uniref:DUF421 domain-containing protein n=1 Tax=Anaerococcus sp. WGS1596 TaxID=3366806 RepID=UPI00372D5DA3